jgi:arsenate reductase
MKVTIYHNPRCSKSRAALALLREHGIEPQVIEYLVTPPDAATLRRLLKALGMKPRALLRTKEAAYKDNRLDRAQVTDAEIIDAMARHPLLIERPIVVAGSRAAIGRPPEKVLEIL